MRLILIKDVKGLGQAGETVTVKDGYGQNFLVPKKLAVLPDSSTGRTALSTLGHRQILLQRNQEKDRQMADRLTGQALDFEAKGSGGRLYGSITKKDIAARLTVDEAVVVLDRPLKTAGSHTVALKFAPDINTSITVNIVAVE